MNKNLKKRLVLLVLFLFGVYVIYYYLQPKPPLPNTNESIEAQREVALEELKARIIANPPVSQKDRDQALLDLKERMKQ